MDPIRQRRLLIRAETSELAWDARASLLTASQFVCEESIATEEDRLVAGLLRDLASRSAIWQVASRRPREPQTEPSSTLG